MEHNKLIDWMNESEKKLFAIIGKYLDEVKGNNKKTTEICHIGKFIMLLNESVSIFRLSESPDCLLNTNQGIIGLEHQIIVNKSLREQEGCFETIIRSVEQNLLADSSIPNFFANCDILPTANYSLSEKSEVIKTVTNVFKEYIIYDRNIPNPYVENIRLQKYSSKGISIRSNSFGPPLSPSIIKQAILKKEEKLEQYIRNCNSPIWLLLVTGNLKNSSYYIEDTQLLSFLFIANLIRFIYWKTLKGNYIGLNE